MCVSMTSSIYTKNFFHFFIISQNKLKKHDFLHFSRSFIMKIITILIFNVTKIGVPINFYHKTLKKKLEKN